ncbi:hypothetical protein ACHAQD_008656 [Fusarium lateritium]
MLDQEFAALIGATSSIRDEDITNKLPSQADDSLSSLSLTLHVQLARLIARLLGTVYGVGKDYDGTLFSNTQSILRNLAELNRDLSNIINNHFRDSISKASRIATRLLLQYHHSCVSSAQAILKTLRALADEDLIDDSWREDARYVFDTLIAKGSLIAPLRKVELEQLEQKLSALTPASNVITPQLPTEANEGVGEHDDNQEQETEDQDIQAHLTDETGWDLFAANAMAGLTPGELLDLAEQLDVDSFMYQPDM